jgi:Polyketide cyclase / dehydrase and lipid transport
MLIAWSKSKSPLVFSVGGSLREEIVSVDEPRSWGYTLLGLIGPLSALLAVIDGKFLFAPAGNVTVVTWRYALHPRSRASAPALPAFAWFWRGFARQTLEELSNLLID